MAAATVGAAASVGAAATLVSSITSVAKKVASVFSKSSTSTTTSSTTTSSSSSSSSSSTSSTVYSALGNLIKLLPTGTVFLFQYLSPITTNNGSCSAGNKALTAILVAVCGISCFVSYFTDSYTSSDGTTHYGIATISGMWPKSSSSSSSSSTTTTTTSLSSYKLKFTDFVHAFMALIIFAVLSLLDTNVVNCFYPSFLSTEKTIISVLPTVIGSISSTVFVVLPSSRNGIGSTSNSSSSSVSSTSGTSGTTTTSAV